MRPLIAAFGVLIVVPTAGAAAQVRVNVDVGPLITSRLVRDSIVAPLTIQPNPALTVGARVARVISGGWQAGIIGRVGRSDLELDESGVQSHITTLTIWQVGVLLARNLSSRLVADVTVGALVYRPSTRRANLFQDGVPRPIVWGLGLQYEQPISQRVRAGLRVAYDGHRFGTPTLRTNGFRDKQFVHRVFLGVTVGWHGEAREQP